MGSVLVQKEHGSERVAASSSNVERKCLNSVQGYDLGLAFLSWARLRNTSCFNSLCSFFQDSFLAVGTSPAKELFVQFVLLLTTFGQPSLTGTCPLRGQLSRTAALRGRQGWCCTPKLRDPQERSCYAQIKYVRESIRG